MKKLVLMFVAVAAISFASCGNQAQPAPAPVDEDTLEAVIDSDSIVAEGDSIVEAVDSLVEDSTVEAE